jgi:L-ascorbate metabolism protein UlaG (beta-lactamase superfamily)
MTHAHNDHIGDVFTVAARSSGPIVGIFDLTTWLGTKGVDANRLLGMNKGGTIRLDALGCSVTMVDARHSSSFTEADGTVVALGEAAGYVISFDDGPNVYVAGDTSLFGDMEWIGRLYDPQLAILPIGDHFTMDPRGAAWACELLGVDAVIPCHWGTFGLLTGTPAQLSDELGELDLNIEVYALEPGQSC